LRRWLDRGGGGPGSWVRVAPGPVRVVRRPVRAACELVRAAVGAGGDRSAWLRETGSRVGGRGRGRAFWLSPRASVSQSQPMKVITVTSVGLQPTDESYSNFHWLALADGSYLFSVGLQKVLLFL
jgi:hypothetical protein